MPAETWKPLLERFALKAGFKEVAFPDLTGAPELAAGAALWRASYGQLLVMCIDGATEQALRTSAALGQDWLDVACMAEERSEHRVMDAYLLLVSRDVLPDTLFTVVREIELNPTTCRKHVAWPSAGTEEEVIWRRILRVTALGLPESPAASGMTNTPTLESAFEKQLLKDVKDLKGKPAARQHAEHPLTDDAA